MRGIGGQKMANECCQTCHYFGAIRKHPTYQEVLTNVCLYFIVEHFKDYILEVKEHDMCECWTKRSAEDGKR